MTNAQGVGFSGVFEVLAAGTPVARFYADNGRCHADGIQQGDPGIITAHAGVWFSAPPVAGLG